MARGCSGPTRPEHGAAVVRFILSSGDLSEAWRANFDTMRPRIQAVRVKVAAVCQRGLNLSPIARRGIYAVFSIYEAEARYLREGHGIYVDVILPAR